MTFNNIPDFGTNNLMSQKELDSLLDALPNDDEWISAKNELDRKIANYSNRIFLPDFGINTLMSQKELDRLVDSLLNEDEWSPPENELERKISEYSDLIFLKDR